MFEEIKEFREAENEEEPKQELPLTTSEQNAEQLQKARELQLLQERERERAVATAVKESADREQILAWLSQQMWKVQFLPALSFAVGHTAPVRDSFVIFVQWHASLDHVFRVVLCSV